MKIKFRGFCFFRRPRRVRVPCIGPTLENIRLPSRFFSNTMQVVAEKRRLDRLAELPRRFVTPKWNDPYRLTLCRLPLPVKPRPRHHEIVVIRVVLPRVLKNLPRPPRIFL